MNAELSKIIAAAITTIGGIAAAWIASRKIRERSGVSHVHRGYTLIHDTYRCIQHARAELGAARILVLRSENGGGVPSALNDAYTRVLRESFEASVGPIEERWQRRRVDASYAWILSEILEHGHLEFTADQLDEGSTLRDVYDSQGIHRAWVGHVGTVPNSAILYVSAAFRSSRDLSAADRVVLDGMVSELRDIFREDHSAFFRGRALQLEPPRGRVALPSLERAIA